MEEKKTKAIPYSYKKVSCWDDYLKSIKQFNTQIIIDFPIIINPNNSKEYGDILKFKNCIFNHDIKIERVQNPLLEINFTNCRFKNTVNINCNKLKRLDLIWYQYSDKLISENYCSINSCFTKSMSISSNEFQMFCKIEGLNQTEDATFNFIANVFLKESREIYPNSETEYTICTIKNSKINNGSFNGNTYYLPFDFSNNSLKYNSHYKGHTFKGNKFQKAYFSKTDFGQKVDFFDCDFDGTTLFDGIKDITTSKLHFRSCKFKGFTHFGSSEINTLSFEYTLFERNVSFNNANFNLLKFHEMRFEKGAFFDNINKNNSQVIENWNRTTLREIKRELANSHNQIDYLRFKSYELNAYKNEVDTNKISWKDSLILYFNKESNNFGLDWTKGITFIFRWSFLFYVLYILSYSAFAEDINCIPKIDNFLVNYLKFINPFSFLKLPIEDSENYSLSFSFFLLGKIFVSYGIYQMVQAFRKFGVNGG
ncbi:hypothetical protein ACHRV5_08020 [Flavobacterium sp. FlaQc-52]|jgi:hypothetical protein|uniref:hypothetical protein n=1 Tax=Flavobacterium sp. FlaQc-52 TaxID=3374185 RepID=UPI003756A352